MSELDDSCATFQLLISPDPPHLQITAHHLSGEVLIEFPKECPYIESFEATKTIQEEFKFELVQPCIKALASSTRTHIRMNDFGLLSFQVFFINLVSHEDKRFKLFSRMYARSQ